MTQSRTARRRLGARLARARVRVRRLLSPSRIASAVLIVGGAAVVYGVSLVFAPAAWVVAGVELVVYALVFIDVDASARRRG